MSRNNHDSILDRKQATGATMLRDPQHDEKKPSSTTTLDHHWIGILLLGRSLQEGNDAIALPQPGLERTKGFHPEHEGGGDRPL